MIDLDTAVQLLANRLWYRTKAKIEQRRVPSQADSSTPYPSPITRLPQDLVEIIISYFIYELDTLLACSLTCYSWYIAAVPHLHHTLTIDNRDGYRWRERRWPRPLRKSYKFGLLPLVKQFRILLPQRIPLLQSRPPVGFTPDWLGMHTLRYFSALTNLRELGIDDLQVCNFMPDIRRYFGHFAPNLRLLALREPKGSCRQILYLIGLFPNLQDLKLCYPTPTEEDENADNLTLVPLSVPPLRGRLILVCFTRVTLVKEMITLFGGLRFRYMDLFRVTCARLLLHASAATLETLRLYPSDTYSEDSFERREDNELKLSTYSK